MTRPLQLHQSVERVEQVERSRLLVAVRAEQQPAVQVAQRAALVVWLVAPVVQQAVVARVARAVLLLPLHSAKIRRPRRCRSS
jgi:hypothetical protein